MKLMTGNQFKAQEFKRYIPHISQQETFISPAEVDSKSHMEVAFYKAKDMYIQNNCQEPIMIEDTALEVEGADIGPNIKHMLDNLQNYEGKKAQWIVKLSTNDGITIKVYEGIIQGIITEFKGTSPFGFDNVFQPDGSDKTLGQMDATEKEIFSARKKACDQFNKNMPVSISSISAIKDWEGEYQED